jgi:hypothetical protein
MTPKDTAPFIAARDRFICRRDGHIPAIRITRQNTTFEKGATYITSCIRCGKVYEEPMPPAAQAG